MAISLHSYTLDSAVGHFQRCLIRDVQQQQATVAYSLCWRMDLLSADLLHVCAPTLLHAQATSLSSSFMTGERIPAFAGKWCPACCPQCPRLTIPFGEFCDFQISPPHPGKDSYRIPLIHSHGLTIDLSLEADFAPTGLRSSLGKISYLMPPHPERWLCGQIMTSFR